MKGDEKGGGNEAKSLEGEIGQDRWIANTFKMPYTLKSLLQAPKSESGLYPGVIGSAPPGSLVK